MDIVWIVAIIAGFFLLIGIGEPLSERLKVPFSVVLAGAGIVVALFASSLRFYSDIEFVAPIASTITSLPITSSVFMYVFLPTLLFQVTLRLNFKRIVDDVVPILSLAVVAVFMTTFFIGYALSFVSTLPLVVCLLIGAIVSTTDPSAVVSIFKSISTPQRLSRLVEGESLLNDAAAIAIFSILIYSVKYNFDDPDYFAILLGFPEIAAGGGLVGIVMAILFLKIMSPFRNHPLAQITLSIALPYLSYIISEQVFGVSGVIAVVSSGIVMSVLAPGKLVPLTWDNMKEVWDILAHWAGALIFILAALLIPKIMSNVAMKDIALLIIVILAAWAARAVVLFGLIPALTYLKLSPRISNSYKTAILWGGLRGAVTLALALAVTEDPFISDETKRIVGILATGFTIFTLVFQGITLRNVIERLQLSKLSSIDRALSNQVVAVALQTVREDVAKANVTYEFSHANVRHEAKLFGNRIDSAVEAAENTSLTLERDRITLGLISLAAAERDLILTKLDQKYLSIRLLEKLISGADKLIEQTRTNGRIGYRKAYRASMGYNFSYSIALKLYTYFGFSGLFSRFAADQFELLLSQRVVLRELHVFIDKRIVRIHGKRIADFLHALLDSRLRFTDKTILAFQKQFPEYSDALERKFIQRITLSLEEKQYRSMLDDGLIGLELFDSLISNLDTRYKDAFSRPRLRVSLSKKDLLLQCSLFANIEKNDIRRIVKSMKIIHLKAMQSLLDKNDKVSGVYFILSGAIEVRNISGSELKVSGSFFGRSEFLPCKMVSSDVRAVTPATILYLGDADFEKLKINKSHLSSIKSL